MAEQVYFEDIEVGAEIPPLVKQPSTRQLVLWAGASRDLAEIHYDKDAALAAGLPGVVVHGRLKAAFLGQLMTDWIGEKGVLRKLTCSYRGLDVPGQPIQCKGKVTRKYAEGDACCVECEVWTENAKEERTTIGTAVAVLPSRGLER